MRRLLTLASLTVLAACATPRGAPTAPPPSPPVQPPPAATTPPPAATTAAQLGVSAGPVLATLPGWTDADLKPAVEAFRKSCRAVTRRTDASGLTQAADWADACAAAPSGAADPRAFFETHFTAVTVGSGTGLNTGYFEPELVGSRTPSAVHAVPIYRRPSDLIEVDLGLFSDNLKGRRIRGRVKGQELVLYHDRGAIEDGALAGRGLELAYAADPYELFFLHIQGSGRLRLPDGSVMRIGYDGQNGREYLGIGRALRERNILPPGGASMDGILAWLRANPEEGRALMRENKSYIFFKELTGEGPLGALNMALTPEYSVAADPMFVPLGAPLWIDTTIPEPVAATASAAGPNGAAPARPAAVGPDRASPARPAAYRMTPFRRLMVAQDTGGAIKGPNRFDLFWGAGERARKVAGGLSSQGRATLLLPKAAAARLLSGGAQARP